jgi:hypothetical protein
VRAESRDGESHLAAEDIVSVFWNCLFEIKIGAMTLYFRGGEEKGPVGELRRRRDQSERDQETVIHGINTNPPSP